MDEPRSQCADFRMFRSPPAANRRYGKTLAAGRWAAVVVFGWLATACGSEDAPSAPATEGSERGGAVEEQPPGPVASDPTFELRAEAQGPYSAGEEGTFTVVLTPRGEYHVNQEYPMQVELSGPDGVTLPAEPLGIEDAEDFSEQRAAFSVPFTAAAAGEHEVTAHVDFAVCTPAACQPDDRTLALVLPVR